MRTSCISVIRNQDVESLQKDPDRHALGVSTLTFRAGLRRPSATYGPSQRKRLMGGDSRRNSIRDGPRGVVSRTGGIARSIDALYGGLLVRPSADKRPGW